MIKVIIALFLLVPSLAWSATYYCGPSSTGSGNGSNFSNLMSLPDTTGFTRGNTYIIIDGSYGSKTLSTATSGSTTITIKKASTADSAITGYSASLHDGQATFGSITIATQRWIINGVTRTENNSYAAPANYGIKATSIGADSSQGHSANYSEFYYIELGNAWEVSPSSGTINTYDWAVRFVYNQSNIIFSHLSVHNSMAFGIHGSSYLTIEYCDIGPNWNKGALCSPNVITTGHTIRYNRFWDASMLNPNDPTSGTTAEIVYMQGGGAYDGHLIYGNWFKNSRSSGRNAVILIGDLQGGWAANCKVYNNTFVDMNESAVLAMIWLYGGSGNEARNNLFYESSATITANTTSNNITAGSNPFVNYSSYDLRLAGATAAGYSLSSPFNLDPLGTTRGWSGVWDVGAYEYPIGAGGDTTAPTVTAFTITPTTSTSLTVPIATFTATDAVGVTGYCLTETSSPPTSGTCTGSGWSGTAQTSYTFSTDGSKTLWAWAKDATGNISTSLNDSILVDTTRPTILSVNSDKANGSYKAGEVIDIDVTFSETISATGYVVVTLDTGGSCQFSLPSGSFGTCNYTVGAGQTSADLTTTNISGTIVDAVGNAMTNFSPTTNLAANKALVIDTTAPTVLNVTSDSADAIYRTGQVIDIDVTFSETVTSTGNVTVTLETGETDRTCTFTVTGGTTGTCNYTVQAGDFSSDLTTVSVSGTIADVAGNALTNTTPITNLAANKNLVINPSLPTIEGATGIGISIR